MPSKPLDTPRHPVKRFGAFCWRARFSLGDVGEQGEEGSPLKRSVRKTRNVPPSPHLACFSVEKAYFGPDRAYSTCRKGSEPKPRLAMG